MIVVVSTAGVATLPVGVVGPVGVAHFVVVVGDIVVVLVFVLVDVAVVVIVVVAWQQVAVSHVDASPLQLTLEPLLTDLPLLHVKVLQIAAALQSVAASHADASQPGVRPGRPLPDYISN